MHPNALSFRKGSIPPPRSALTVAAASLSVIFLQGCSTPATRAVSDPAAIRALSPDERTAALAGKIRDGFSKNAVLIAWGAPTQRSIEHTSRGSEEDWTWTQCSYGIDNGSFGIPRGWVHDEHGDHYDFNDFYPGQDTAQTLGGSAETDVPIKRVAFKNDRVVSYETAHDGSDADDVR